MGRHPERDRDRWRVTRTWMLAMVVPFWGTVWLMNAPPPERVPATSPVSRADRPPLRLIPFDASERQCRPSVPQGSPRVPGLRMRPLHGPGDYPTRGSPVGHIDVVQQAHGLPVEGT